MADGDNVVHFDPAPPGHHQIVGTDLEIVYDRRGDDLVLRVNKGGVLVFRALLRDAAKEMPAGRIVQFNLFAPDIVATIGDIDEGVRRVLAAGSAAR